jgi:hypothetical protein
LPTFDAGSWQRWQIFAAFDLQAGDRRFEFVVAFDNLGFVEVEKIKRLRQAKTCSARSLPTSAARIVSGEDLHRISR